VSIRYQRLIAIPALNIQGIFYIPLNQDFAGQMNIVFLGAEMLAHLKIPALHFHTRQ
jgi:hypothetical protein